VAVDLSEKDFAKYDGVQAGIQENEERRIEQFVLH